MKKLRFIIPVIAVIATAALVIGTSAFTKKTAEKDPDVFYWYLVDLETQTIPQNAMPVAHSEDYSSPCDSGDDIDCVRGFLVQPNTSLGPVSSRGNVQKMTEEGDQ